MRAASYDRLEGGCLEREPSTRGSEEWWDWWYECCRKGNPYWRNSLEARLWGLRAIDKLDAYQYRSANCKVYMSKTEDAAGRTHTTCRFCVVRGGGSTSEKGLGTLLAAMPLPCSRLAAATIGARRSRRSYRAAASRLMEPQRRAIEPRWLR